MEKVDINQAHEELMIELFGSVPEENALNIVTRSEYTRAMQKIQDKYGLKQGHPDFLGWVFTCVGHSPLIVENTGEDDTNGKD